MLDDAQRERGQINNWDPVVKYAEIYQNCWQSPYLRIPKHAVPPLPTRGKLRGMRNSDDSRRNHLEPDPPIVALKAGERLDVPDLDLSVVRELAYVLERNLSDIRYTHYRHRDHLERTAEELSAKLFLVSGDLRADAD
jgi:hypothetical protein